MDKLNIRIIYKDFQREVVIHDVTDYGFNGDSGLFYYMKNNVRAFMPEEQIAFMGVDEDYD